MLDMIIAFDTTGSMSSYIKNVKQYVHDLIPTLFSDNPNLRLGIVAFGDYCDKNVDGSFGNAYQCLPLCNDVNAISKFVKNAKNTCGGDHPEFYELVIKKITEESAWREGATKSVLLIADATPHDKYFYNHNNNITPIDWETEAEKAAKLNIKFDTLSIRDHDWYDKLSEITGGVHLPFSSSNKTSELIQAAALSRGGTCTRAKFAKSMATCADDLEMTNVYTAYSKTVVK